MKNDVEKMDELWEDLNNTNLKANKRREIYLDMVCLYRNSEEVKKRWEHHPSRRLYVDRFVRCIRIRSLPKKKSTTRKDRAFDDGINYETPHHRGLYFIGQTAFNPYTREGYYWVKIGRGANLANRMSNYNTCCPMLYRIDYQLINDEDKCKIAEGYYHDLLAKKSIATCNHNNEWFLVDRETYLEMCEKGFSYFN